MISLLISALWSRLHWGMTENASTLTGVRVWDGLRDVGVRDLRWDGDQIEALDASADERWPDLCVLPGLVDTHVHLVGRASTDVPQGPNDTSVWPLVTTREEQVLHAAANAQRAMRYGVTTLRDLASDETQVAVSRAFDAALMPGPRVLASGAVGRTGGHMDLFVPPAHPIRQPTADGPDECRKLVRSWARKGLTGIKIFTSGGVLSMSGGVGARGHTDEEIRATVDEAHALGMLVAAHAHTVAGIQAAIDAGVDSVEHATELTGDQAETVADKGISVGPTLLINDAIAHGRVPVRPDAQQKAAGLVPARDALFRAAAAAGVRFVLATDASGYVLRFGDQMAETVRMADVLQVDAQTALRAATSTAAASVGMGDQVGSLDTGRRADFLVMRGRPWERIEDLHTDNIVAVVCRGAVVRGQLPVSDTPDC